MFLGLRTVIYPVSDMTAAKEWYARLAGKAPYFDEPFYVGFSVGGYELGLHPAEGEWKGRGPVVYWGVASMNEAVEELKSREVEGLSEVQDVGGGIKVATFLDPFGNTVGVIENPHFRIEAP